MSGEDSKSKESGARPEAEASAAAAGEQFAAGLQQMMGAWAKFMGDAASAMPGAGTMPGVTPPSSTDTGAAGAPAAAVEAMGELAAGKFRVDPAQAMEAQMQLLRDYQQLWMNTASRLAGGGGADADANEPREPVATPAPDDHRYTDPEWSENPVFDYIKQAYLLNAAWVRRMVESVEGLDADEARKLDFFSRQFVDALSPTNLALTNPVVLREAMASGGGNFVKGAENLARVLEQGHGPLQVEQVDRSAFEVGGNVAITPGEVVFRNHLFELIQYAPTTEKVHQRPLLIVPPWINKYYILDLKPENSFVAWCVARGHTVFMISWVNPDESHRDCSFEEYMTDGIFAALDAVERATGESEVNAIGYCIGGTLLSVALAIMADDRAAGSDVITLPSQRIVSATFFAAQVDFEEGGELRVFTDPATLQLIAQEVEQKGYLDGSKMGAAFNLLRSNDLLWSYVVNNYLMGKSPPAFDLLYWNSDSTRFPARLLFDYLKDMYQENLLSKPDGFEVGGHPVDISHVSLPVYLQAARQDHIAPPGSVFKGTRIFSGCPVRFVLAGSGHIAGVVNPPEKQRYQHWTNERAGSGYGTVEEWLEDASEHPGSWWTDWDAWMDGWKGAEVPARVPGGGELAAIEPAPGSYVRVRWE